MFDIGFPELLLVSVVALLVIGPERLPETVRTIMVWMGKIKRSFASIKTELEQEIGVDEIRQQIHNDTIMKELNKGREEIENVFDDVQQNMQDAQNEIRATYTDPIGVNLSSEENKIENELIENDVAEGETIDAELTQTKATENDASEKNTIESTEENTVESPSDKQP